MTCSLFVLTILTNMTSILRRDILQLCFSKWDDDDVWNTKMKSFFDLNEMTILQWVEDAVWFPIRS